MRKGIVFLSSILWSIAHAGDMGDASCRDKNNPHCKRASWHLGIKALYLQPRYSGFNQFGVVGNTPPGTAPSQLSFQAVDDSWGWGFRIDTAYYFHPENDLSLNWSSYNVTTNRGTIIVPAGGSFTDSLSNEYSSGTISTLRRPTWDAVNAEVGQMLHIGESDDIRFHGGVQYARIKTQVSLSEPAGIDPATYVTQRITYSGFGPRAGIDASYFLRPALAIYADAAAGILIGPTQFYDTGIGGHNILQLVTGRATAIVPELEAKLGLKYTHLIEKGELCFDLGWMWNNYFSSQVNNHGTDTHESDFGLQGLFFGMLWRN